MNIYKPTAEEIKTILENHNHWLKKDCEGCIGMRADLRGADIRGADLSVANLRGADIRGANLHGADISGTDLSWADLRDADLSWVDLRGANLHGADLSWANLHGANLHGANLHGANLHGADLRGAIGITMNCPSDGSFIGWKKACNDNEYVLVKLQIPEDAKRSSGTGRKCRCDKAKVLGIFGFDGKEYDEAHSDYDVSFIYKVGEMVIPDDFDENRWNECSNGIHFFITKTEAEEYKL